MRQHLLRVGALLLLPIQFLSCSSTQIYPQNPLASEILYPRPGHDGKLTNQTCVSLDKKGNCTNWSVKEYDLNDEKVRAELNKLEFVCKIAGHRYKVCDTKPGFCHITFSQKCF